MTLLIIVLILALLWVLAVQGRSSHPGMKELRGWNYAHRGLHGDGAAENSMTAFRLAVENGYGMEFDLHLLKDGNLGVMHDSLLNRTTGQAGRIEDLYTQDLKNYRLENTEDTIPQFADVLTLVDGKVPLIIELKTATMQSSPKRPARCWRGTRAYSASSPLTPGALPGCGKTVRTSFAGSFRRIFSGTAPTFRTRLNSC